jgi:hypothetical protein
MLTGWMDGATAQEGGPERPLFDFPGASPATEVIARVGPVSITAQQFLLNYEFGPAAVKRRERGREEYLECMISEKLLALDAHERGFARLPRVRETLAEVESDLATEELYRDDVLAHVAVGDSEIARGVRDDRTEVSLRWVFAPTRDALRPFEVLLGSGATFDSLLTLQARDSVPEDDRQMRSTLFRLHEKNAVLARVVRSLRPGSVSAPIEAPDGWYLVELQDRLTLPLLSETETAASVERVRKVFVRDRADSLSDRYLQTMMIDARPEIQFAPFLLVARFLAGTLLPPDGPASWGLAPVVSADSMRGAAASVLVQLRRDKGILSVKDFLRWYEGRSANLKSSRSSRDGYLQSIEQMIWRMVRDRLLAARAAERGLRMRPAVITQRRWWEEKLLFEAARDDIARTITTPDSVVRAYYGLHAQRYSSPVSGIRSFEEAHDAVRRDYFDEQMAGGLYRRLSALRTKFAVEINRRAFDALPRGNDVGVRTIEVYAVKTGGIFPRQAFPVVDRQWSVWR